MAQNVLSRESVDRVFRDVIERCAIQQNPGGAIPRDGSSDRPGGCLELRGEWRMRHADELYIFHLNPGGLRNPHTSAHLPGTAPGHHNGVGPGGIGKAQSAEASSKILATQPR